MMGLAKMDPQGWRYYAEEIGLGREDYFAGHGEEQGRWAGRGAEALGLVGTVSPDQMERLFGHGRHPVADKALGRRFANERQGGAEGVAGYALSFSPPKSISLLWALADGSVSDEVRAAHDAAVAEALEFLQDHAAFTRRGKGGAVQAATDGYLAAAFVHRTSRALDPQLHTHVLVSAKVRASADGHWLSLDGRELFEVQKAAGLLYKAGLRAELTRRLGVAWTGVDRGGAAEVACVPAGLIERFSRRRAEVEAAAAQLVSQKETALGRSLGATERAAAYQLAAYQSRAPKVTGGETTGELRARWRREASDAGYAPERWLPWALDPSRPDGPPRYGRAAPPPSSTAGFVAEVLETLEARQSTWGRADAVEVLAVRAAPLLRSAQAVRRTVDAASDELLADSQVVRLGAEADVAVPTARNGAVRYTTERLLRAEQAVLGAAEAGRGAGVSVVDSTAVEAAIARSGLGDDQAEAVRRLCQGGERISVMVGPAGSGKSKSLSAAGAAWESARVPVRGLAPSAVAAGVLAEQAGIASETLAKFLLDASLGRGWPRPGEVMVCDEASMVPTRDLALLVALVEQAKAKLVLVGDHLQLGAVGAGGLFRLLVADAKTAELGTVRRFSDRWEAGASLRLRDRDATVLDEYLEHGRVVGGGRAEAMEAAHRAWLGARAEGRSVVVMAPDHATVDQLALRARATRVVAGEVEEAAVAAGSQLVGMGDEVVTTMNDRRLVTSSGAWVRNGDRWQVLTRRPDDSLLLSSLDGRGKVSVPGRYVKDSVALAYAVTVHKGQGLTTDRAILLVDGATTAEHLYVGMTRGREHNLACAVCEPFDDGHRHYPAPNAREVLATALRRTGTEVSATEAALAEGGHEQPEVVEILAAALRRRQPAAYRPHLAAGSSADVSVDYGPEL
ncbi:MAG TPA: MobF family relaxase [Acidimicrobiales bacterium]|nr:MobF family relaxase [Acidimicrobiales bacterium]